MLAKPPGALPIASRRIEALLAILGGARTVPAVMVACGWKSKATAWEAVTHLRDLGFVTWDEGRAGTLRPLVRPVPVDLTALNVGSEL